MSKIFIILIFYYKFNSIINIEILILFSLIHVIIIKLLLLL